ncbi:TonB-dependent receptor [Zhouia sp. PK063]|uniref:TonB-dependent receptor n=1 Tax=Zhouia sp. PK063 TaxID=3373602 RepID=UPI0037B15BAE
MKYVCTLLLCLSFLGIRAQELKITGKVTDENGPLAGANVIVKGTNKGTLTNFDGVFSLTLLKGQYTLVVSYAGIQKEQTVNLQQSQTITVKFSQKDNVLDEVLVSAIRVNGEVPVTYSNLTKKEIESRNLGQDIPFLMNYMPSVVTTSDAGAGVGYTGIRVRGSDATRVNVTINGIPYNDAESQGTYWVDLPDFASSVQSLQLQRGVGTSSNGAGAFGASLNVLTDAVSQHAYAEIANSFGSFNTHKHNVKFSTGKLDDHFELQGRFSTIQSDGYIDRASSNLNSYFLQAAYVDDNTLIKALLFGGHEKTYQSWNGIENWQIEEFGRRYNSAGEYTDEDGNTKYYDNEIDNYDQNHFQLLWNQQLDEHWSTNIALHYTKGNGYYEQYEEDQDFADYGLQPIEIGGQTIDSTNLITRKWLDNDFYGTTFSAKYQQEGLDVTFGGAWNKYEGDHYGEIIWARYASNSEIRDHYYDGFGNKTDFNFYTKANFKLSSKLNAYGDVQYRRVTYAALSGNIPTEIEDDFNFFNPKVGLTYNVNSINNIYFSYAHAHREPNRTDYENGSPKPEKLHDFELGWRYNASKVKLNSNVYYMRYKDQLVLTGALDDVGAPIRANSGDSYRLGLEVDATINFENHWFLQPNVALSTNKNIDFVTQRDGELQNLGNTNISYSPNIVAGNRVTYMPVPTLQLSLLSKYVGEQYLANIDAEDSKLEAYFTSSFNVQYEIPFHNVLKSIVLTGLVNNIFNEKYSSNGYYYTYDVDNDNGSVTTYGGTGYYPQAGTNFLVGATLKF